MSESQLEKRGSAVVDGGAGVVAGDAVGSGAAVVGAGVGSGGLVGGAVSGAV